MSNKKEIMEPIDLNKGKVVQEKYFNINTANKVDLWLYPLE